MNSSTPQIKIEELTSQIKAFLPNADLKHEIISKAHGSWSLNVRQDRVNLEFIWGPESGFGASDLARPNTPNDSPFHLADDQFNSLEEGIAFLKTLIQKYA